MPPGRVYVGSDHAGFALRRRLVERLRAQGREVVDVGPDTDATCDYPELAHAVANAVRSHPGSLGILACATGQGMAIAAGKVRGIRAVVPASVEAARLTRFDNDANILCLGSRLMPEAEAFAIADTWLSTGFAGGRHARRIAKIAAIETAAAIVFMTESERLRLRTLGIPARLFDQDARLWCERPELEGPIRQGLGWVALPREMAARLPEVNELAREARRLPVKDLVLLVEDPLASAAVTMGRICGGGGPRLHVVGPAGPVGDGEDPETLSERVRRSTTLVLVATRSAHCPELEAQEARLWTAVLASCGGDAPRAGKRFVAACGEGDWQALAREHHYRQCFVHDGPPNEDLALLGLGGLVTAALLGVDGDRLLQRAGAMATSCRKERVEDNPGVSLGILLGAMAKHGRRKLTLLLSRSLWPLGPWIARLLSPMSGPAAPGIVASHGEAILPSYPPDRIFVHLQATNDEPAATSEEMESLHGAGQPYIQIAVADRLELAAEIFRWQVAAAVASLVMGSDGPPGFAPKLPIASSGR